MIRGIRANRMARTVLLTVLCCGCGARPAMIFHRPEPADLHYYEAQVAQVEYPDAACCAQPAAYESLGPRDMNDELPEFWDLTLDAVIEMALRNSAVIRNLGGSVLRSPQTASTVYDPAIQQADPVYGPEGALSAFDAQLATALFWSQNDRVYNSRITGGGVNEFQQDLHRYTAELSKKAATGTEFSARNETVYDANNGTVNLFPSAWDTQFEFSVRQPLLQGGGIAFNRIAGPDAQPGLYSRGVVIGRMNAEIGLSEFEAAVRDFISEVEDAYWELYFAYRDLDAKLRARDHALETWRSVQARFEQQLASAAEEAQAREQYFAFQDQVIDALNGTPHASLSVGVYNGERRLRQLMGVTANDGRLIRPADEIPPVQIHYSWESCLAEALTRRVELRRQRCLVKRRELELVAARNFLLPKLDAFALYRFRGFGDDLIGGGPGRFASAYKDLASGDHQEWEAGIQFEVPIGYRQAFAGVRHAELQLRRERAVLQEQEFQISHQLYEALSELARASEGMRSSFNRLTAARQNADSIQVLFDKGLANADAVLRAAQRLGVAESSYYRRLADYAQALKSVESQKGSLLDSHGVCLSEGSWPAGADPLPHRFASGCPTEGVDYRLSRPPAIRPESSGQPSEHAEGRGGVVRRAAPPRIEEVPRPAPSSGQPPPG